MTKLAVMLFLTGLGWGQTRLALRQLAPGGTQLRGKWQRGFQGHAINVLQAPKLPGVTLLPGWVIIDGPEGRCTVGVRQGFGGLVQVVLYRGRVGVMAGHGTATGYRPTLQHVEIHGPCVPVEVADGKYPAGIHAHVYCAAVGMPTPEVPLRGLDAPFMPVAYSLRATGLVEVSGLQGQRVVWCGRSGKELRCHQCLNR